MLAKTSVTHSFDVFLISISELVVDLPTTPVKIHGNVDGVPGKPVGGYFIRVSNDGNIYSVNESLFVVYDSKCMVCSPVTDSGKMQCKQKVWKL